MGESVMGKLYVYLFFGIVINFIGIWFVIHGAHILNGLAILIIGILITIRLIVWILTFRNKNLEMSVILHFDKDDSN